ncbi:hypothetical protein EVG20_g9838 [Dentipellis fragilis]|uniref:Uncharacterized protein n=1 Tax=Dentipellis fragilis TaxID=205917 RepID=A0A4Y9XY89_9AGAM|nr:hypothetical protein EVG20_g9838 [Dentipellis fragilis]
MPRSDVLAAACQAESQVRSAFAIRDDEAWHVSCEEIHQWHLAVMARGHQGYGLRPEPIPGHYDYRDPGEGSDKENEHPSKRPRMVSGPSSGPEQISEEDDRSEDSERVSNIGHTGEAFSRASDAFLSQL